MREDIDYLDDEEGHDFITLGKEIIQKIPFKKAALLAIALVFVLNTVFIKSFLNFIPGAVIAENPTTKGSFIQIACIVVAYIFIDLVVNAEWI